MIAPLFRISHIPGRACESDKLYYPKSSVDAYVVNLRLICNELLAENALLKKDTKDEEVPYERFVIECRKKYKCKLSYFDQKNGLMLVKGQMYEVESENDNMYVILGHYALSRMFVWEHFTDSET